MIWHDFKFYIVAPSATFIPPNRPLYSLPLVEHSFSPSPFHQSQKSGAYLFKSKLEPEPRRTEDPQQIYIPLTSPNDDETYPLARINVAKTWARRAFPYVIKAGVEGKVKRVGITHCNVTILLD